MATASTLHADDMQRMLTGYHTTDRLGTPGISRTRQLVVCECTINEHVNVRSTYAHPSSFRSPHTPIGPQAYTFGSGVIPDAAGGDGCTDGIVLNAQTDPSCSLKCTSRADPDYY